MKNWDFDYEDEPELEPQPLVPVTNNPLSFGPSAKSRMQTKVKRATAEQYRKWIQRFLYFLQLPMSNQALNDLSVGELRVIASLFKAYNGNDMRYFNKNELIRFVAGHQQDREQYHPIPHIKGVKLPKLKDQEYRRIFQSKIDPWERPR